MNHDIPTKAGRRERKKRQKMAMHGKGTRRLAQHIAQRKGRSRA